MEHITITRANAPGIAPVSQTPPGYEVEAEGDNSIAAGLLENGNQRFMVVTQPGSGRCLCVPLPFAG